MHDDVQFLFGRDLHGVRAGGHTGPPHTYTYRLDGLREAQAFRRVNDELPAPSTPKLAGTFTVRSSSLTRPVCL
jgi:hypothetical protein